jgi:hypothetical protein
VGEKWARGMTDNPTISAAMFALALGRVGWSYAVVVVVDCDDGEDEWCPSLSLVLSLPSLYLTTRATMDGTMMG